MRVGIIHPDRPQWPKLRWVEEALRSLDVDVERGRGAADFARLSQECDLLILGHKGVSCRWPDVRDLFPLRKAFVVQLWFDLIAFDPGADLISQSYLANEGQLALMRACDMVCVKESEMLDEFRNLGVHAEYLDQGCPGDIPEVIRAEEPQWDVLVWGQGRGYPDRCRDASGLVDAGYRVAWASEGFKPPRGIAQLAWCHPDRLPELAGRARFVLSVDRRHDVPGYCSDRLWMALGMGCAVLRRFTPGMPDGLEEHAIVYRHRGEMLDAIRKILETSGASTIPPWPPGVVQLGTEARKWCLENHSIVHRCQQLLKLVAAKSAEVAAA